MHPIEHYDVLRQARAKVLDRARELSEDEYAREFPFGLKSIRATLVHVAAAEWIYNARARGEDFRREEIPFREERYPDFASLEADWRDLEARTRAWLQSETDWDRPIEYTVALPGGGRVRVATTPQRIAFQMFYHEVHHRAQVMAMLRQLGHPVEDVDFSRWAYRRTDIGD
ncbi:MAG: DinB family protein [Armatimonadota bacterium]|nr:DinB family protein [Armatimonadota bacterium]MDR5696832.1 DinB family protein [Armatimonadota bacterium]